MTASMPAAPSEMAPVSRSIVTVVAVFTMVSPYLADWNATHIYNPLWPPHAKFHNAQTLLMGSMLGACALYFLWGRGDARARFHAAMLFAGLYWVTQMGSIALPGTAFVDPERAGTGMLLGIPAQIVIDVVVLALLGVAAVLGRRPLRA